jgi:glucose-1-phosphate cytidylyltransferase
MQVVILCGGQGTRIRDVAEDLPKPMLPIGNRPILWHIMKGYAHYGFNNFVLCLGHKGSTIKRYFLDYHLFQSDISISLGRRPAVEIHGTPIEEDWHITLAETGLESMTGCRLKRVAPYIKGEHFMMAYGDGVADVDFRDLLRFHLDHGRLATLTAVQPSSRFGEIELHGETVSQFKEKPLRARGRVSAGFFVFRREVLDRLTDDPQLVLEQEPLVSLAREGQLMGYLHDGFWQAMDNSREFKYLNDLWASGSAPWKTWDVRPVRAAA